MSEPQDKLDISDLKETFLECPVCVEHFNQTDKRPRLLHSCLHAFCTQCLHHLLLKEGKGQITCPLCRQVQIVKGKVDSLPIDPVRNKLVDYVQIKHQKKILCTDCPDGNEAQGRCEECLVYLCKDCIFAHRRHRLSRDHIIVSLDEVLEQPLKEFSLGHFCPFHPKHHLEFYCSTDEQLCCISCTVLGHKGHEFEKLEDAAAKRKVEIEKVINKVYEARRHLTKKQQEAKGQENDVHQIRKQSISEVNDMFDDMKRQLDQRRQQLLSKIQDRSSSMLASIQKTVSANDQTLAIIESTDTYFTQVKEKADVVEMLQMYPAIKRSLTSLHSAPDRQDEKVDTTKLKYFPNQRSEFDTLVKNLGNLTDEEVKTIILSTICVKPLYLEAMMRIFGEKQIQEFCRITEDAGLSGKSIQFIVPPGREKQAREFQQRAGGLIQEDMCASQYSGSVPDTVMKATTDVYIKYLISPFQRNTYRLTIFALDSNGMTKAKMKVAIAEAICPWT